MEPPAQLLTLPQEMLARPPSRADGVDAPTEHAYRIWACELVQDMGIALRLAQVVMATAQSLVQRFYYRKSLAAYDGHVVAMAALFLAAKVEEQPRRMRDVINVCYHAKLRRQGKPLRPITLGGGLYLAWKAALIRTERVLLKETGFSTYNLMAHPHKFILYYVRTLGEGAPADALAQAAWAYLNDSLRLDLCVRYSAESIACAALYLAARATAFPLPRSVPWHAVFSTSRAEMHDIAEEILTLYDDDGGGGDGADAGFGGGAASGAGASSSSSAAAAATAAGGSTVRTRLDSPTLRRGPGRPLRWLPSLRPDARPGDDEDEGEAPGPGAGGGLSQPQSQHSATTDAAPSAAGPGGGVPSTAALTEIVAAAAAAAAAKAAQLALSASSASAAAPPAPATGSSSSAAAGGDAGQRREHHHHHHRHHHGGGGSSSSRRGSIGSDGAGGGDGAGREQRRSEQPRRDDKDAGGGGARRSRFRSRSRSR